MACAPVGYPWIWLGRLSTPRSDSPHVYPILTSPQAVNDFFFLCDMVHKATLFVFLLAVGACGTAARATNSDEPLRFRREGDWLKFKVLVFSDLY